MEYIGVIAHLLTSWDILVTPNTDWIGDPIYSQFPSHPFRITNSDPIQPMGISKSFWGMLNSLANLLSKELQRQMAEMVVAYLVGG